MPSIHVCAKYLPYAGHWARFWDVRQIHHSPRLLRNLLSRQRGTHILGR